MDDDVKYACIAMGSVVVFVVSFVGLYWWIV